MHKFLIGVASAAVLAGSASAQSGAKAGLEGRVGKLEGEMRAVQRKVFPGGALVEPQIAPAERPAEQLGVPSASAVADLSQRVEGLEQQQRELTSQVEQAQYRLRQLEDNFNAYKKATDARLSGQITVPTAPRPAAEGEGGPAEEGAVVPPPVTRGRGAGTLEDQAAKAGVSGDPAAPAPAAAGVARPDTGDAPEDAYTYGYRLWEAKRYAAAETQLKKVVADYPRHRRASYAQNLLGRSYLDDGKPSLASIAFYDNYKKFPDGERAPESLYYLGQSLTKLNKPADACKVYGELTDVYGAKIDAAMKARVATARRTSKCK